MTPSQTENRPVSPTSRLINAWKYGLKHTDYMLSIGSVKLTVGDMCTILHPSQESFITDKPPNFVAGWLADTVLFIAAHDQSPLDKQ